MREEVGQVYLMECNEWCYVGVHCGDIIKDRYYGSGLAWNNVVRKYGKDNIKRTIICTFEGKEEKQILEKKFIAYYRAKCGDKCLNISDGGDGGNLGEEICKKISLRIRGTGNGMYGKKLTEETKRKISEALKGHPNYNPKGYKHTEEAKARIRSAHIGIRHTEETKERLREARRNQKNVCLNGCKGMHWYVSPDGVEEKICLDKEAPYGWCRGRGNQQNKGKIYHTNGERDILLYPTDSPPVGYIKGRHFKINYTEDRNRKISEKLRGRKVSKNTKELLSNALRGRHWYNNGVMSKQLFECPLGWARGMAVKRRQNEEVGNN